MRSTLSTRPQCRNYGLLSAASIHHLMISFHTCHCLISFIEITQCEFSPSFYHRFHCCDVLNMLLFVIPIADAMYVESPY
jgi:hypothetical protein